MNTMNEQNCTIRRPLSTREAADYLNISVTMLYRHVKDGRIRAFKPSGKKLYFRIEDLDSWIEGGGAVCENPSCTCSARCTDCSCS